MSNDFASLQSELNEQFPERREVIEGTLAAILAGEHVLMLGPPGTAKSALVRAISSAFSAVYFERLMTRFTTPEELFGPMSIKALEQDRYARVTTGKLPEAQFAFVDEVFKSNSAILNTLLTAMNERLFHNDGAPTQMPLVSLFGASNEMPEAKELEALWDRFIVRFEVCYIVRRTNRRKMLLASEPVSTVRLSMADLKTAQEKVRKVKILDATVDSLMDIGEALMQEGIAVSDRRLKKCLRLVQAAAFLAGETEATPEDLICLVDALWREPKERAKVARIVGNHADPVGVKIREVIETAREEVRKIDALKSGDRKQYMMAASSVLAKLKAFHGELETLAKEAGRRSKKVAQDGANEIADIHSEFTRMVSIGAGLNRPTVALGR